MTVALIVVPLAIINLFSVVWFHQGLEDYLNICNNIIAVIIGYCEVVGKWQNFNNKCVNLKILQYFGWKNSYM